MGPYREIVISEHAPGADHFDALRLVRIDQKVVSHRDLPSTSNLVASGRTVVMRIPHFRSRLLSEAINGDCPPGPSGSSESEQLTAVCSKCALSPIAVFVCSM